MTPQLLTGQQTNEGIKQSKVHILGPVKRSNHCPNHLQCRLEVGGLDIPAYCLGLSQVFSAEPLLKVNGQVLYRAKPPETQNDLGKDKSKAEHKQTRDLNSPFSINTLETFV